MEKRPKIYKPFFIAAALVAAMLALLLAATYTINNLSICFFNLRLFTNNQFSDLVQTLTIIILVTIEVPFLTCGIGYYLQSKRHQ